MKYLKLLGKILICTVLVIIWSGLIGFIGRYFGLTNSIPGLIQVCGVLGAIVIGRYFFLNNN